MIRNRKTLNLTLIAVFAVSAFSAQAACAAPLTVNEGGIGTTYYTADQDGGVHVFRNASGEVKCTIAFYTATSVGESVNELTLTPHYTTCTAFGFPKTDINTNGCTYTFTEPTGIGSGNVTWDPEQLHIVCPVGKTIEITPTFTFLGVTVAVCTQFIGPQTLTGGHIVGRGAGTGTPNGMDVTLEITLEGISYTSSGEPSPEICGSKGEVHTDGVLFGNSTLRAFSNVEHTAQRGITFS